METRSMLTLLATSLFLAAAPLGCQSADLSPLETSTPLELDSPSAEATCAPEQDAPGAQPGGDALLSVPLTVSNALTVARAGEYVTTGVPLPRSWNVSDASQLAVFSPTGLEVPSQITVSARWGGLVSDSARPIKWALITFPADVPAGGQAIYTLKGGQVNHTAPGLTVTSSTSSLVVDSGLARFSLNKLKFSLLEEVIVGGQTVTRSAANGIELLDPSGVLYSSANDTPTQLVLEENGPLKVVVRVEGSLRKADGAALTDYAAWLSFYAGQSHVKLLYTVGNHRPATLNGTSYDVYNYLGGNSISFRDLSVVTSLYSPAAPLSFLVPVDSGTRTGTLSSLSVLQDSSGTDYWNRYASVPKGSSNYRLNSYVSRRGYQVTSSGNSLAGGNQFKGWLDVSDASRGVTVGVKGFWQQFPKGLSAGSDGKLKVELFPAAFGTSAGYKHNLRVGEEKTHELFLYFHPGSAVASGAEAMASRLLAPLTAVAPAAWYTDTGAVQPYAVPEGSLETRFGAQNATDDGVRHDYYNERTLLADPQNAQAPYYHAFHSLWLSSSGHPSSTDYFDFYGWSWYGNQPLEEEAVADGQSGPFNVKYNLDYGAWMQYLRTGDIRWRGMAEAASGARESLMLHEVVTETGWDVARWKNAVWGHSNHNESGNLNGARNTLGPVIDTAFGAEGAVLEHYLTGNPVARRFALAAADYAYNFYQSVTPANDPDFAPGREAGNLLAYLNEGFRLTGDRKYETLALRFITDYAAEKQAYTAGPIPGSTLSLPVWIFGLYYKGIARYAELADEWGLSSQKASAVAQLSAWVRWHMTYATKKPQGWRCSYYYYAVNGQNDASSTDMINNWTLLLADANAYAYDFTGDSDFLTWGGELFHTGAVNPYFLGSPLIYSSSKEAVNHLVFGQVYRYLVQAPPSAPPVDSLPPVVNISSPAAGAQVSGQVSVEVAASDASGVSAVQLLVDGAPVGSPLTSAPYRQTVDLSGHASGPCALQAKATDVYGNAASSPVVTVQVISPVNHAPTAAFVFSPSAPLAGSPVSFDASSASDPDGQALSYTWSFGDGGSASGKQVSHTFAAAGSFPVKLTVSDGALSASATLSVVVSAASSGNGVLLTFSSSTGMRDVTLRASYEGNYGKAGTLTVYNASAPDYRAVLYFDLSKARAPRGKTLYSAKLNLTAVSVSANGASSVPTQVFRLTQSWTEGSGTYGNTLDGATWKTRDGSQAWSAAGGAIDLTTDYGSGANGLVAQKGVAAGSVSLEIAPLVQAWLSGKVANYGLLLAAAPSATWSTIQFASKEDATTSRRPTLVLEYR